MHNFKYLICLIFMVVNLTPASAQKHLEGLWEGVLTTGGIYTDKGVKFELFLEIEGPKVKGRSYVHLDDDTIVQMEIVGKMYEDRSFYFHDVKFIPPEGVELLPIFKRKYQLIYSRSIWNTTLEGYWQEITPQSFKDKRERGRIYLKKSVPGKA